MPCDSDSYQRCLTRRWQCVKGFSSSWWHTDSACLRRTGSPETSQLWPSSAASLQPWEKPCDTERLSHRVHLINKLCHWFQQRRRAPHAHQMTAAETLILTFGIILEASKWCGCFQCVFREHRCLIQKTLIVVTKRHNVAIKWDTHSMYLVQYFILLVRNFPRVAKAGGVLGHNSTHCGEVICGTKTQIGYWGTAKVCEH